MPSWCWPNRCGCRCPLRRARSSLPKRIGNATCRPSLTGAPTRGSHTLRSSCSTSTRGSSATWLPRNARRLTTRSRGRGDSVPGSAPVAAAVAAASRAPGCGRVGPGEVPPVAADSGCWCCRVAGAACRRLDSEASSESRSPRSGRGTREGTAARAAAWRSSASAAAPAATAAPVTGPAAREPVRTSGGGALGC